MHPIQELERLGQSLWLDTIDRDLLASGGLKRLIEEEGIRGVTTNPTIFEQAIAHGTAYDAAIAAHAVAGMDAAEIYETLAAEDVRAAADQLRPVHEMSGGLDGYVSLEVAPALAWDTAGTVAEARRLWARVDRPNVMVKVPGTREGLPAVEQLLADGLNVNVTLLFAVEVYRDVIDAYLTGLERRARAREPLERVRSVASFFVSRVDTEVDRRLEAAAAARPGERARLRELEGRAAVANAKLAYAAYLDAFYAPRFRALLAKGANVQRPLWASTGTKNPAYPDTLYVDALIGPDTVNTVPLATLHAFRDHGTVARTLDRDVAEAAAHLAAVEAAGVSLRDVTAQLAVDGVRKFADSHRALLGALAEKRDVLLARRRPSPARGVLTEQGGARALAARDGAERVRRLYARDPGLWPGDDAAHREIARRLGWLDLPDAMEPRLADLQAFANEVRAAGFARVLLLGMGGSSLAPETFARAFGPRAGFPTLAVLDTTDPGAIAAAERAAPLERTFFLVSSKSGTTIETGDLFTYFWDRTHGNGTQFAAITDPCTPLAILAGERGLSWIFEGPPDVGGRFSALSCFGLVPAALLGVDLQALLARAAGMARRCAPSSGGGENPGLDLGAALASAAAAGRDKVTFVAAPALEPFAAWVEQLLAESTGKRGKGLVPVVGEAPQPPSYYGPDRLFVSLELGGASGPESAARVRGLEAAGHAVIHVVLTDLIDIGAEFYRWEVATALVGSWLGVNPFDQPNVAESKANTDRVLQALVAGESPAAPAAVEPARLTAALAAWLALVRPGDYVSVLAYLAPGAVRDAELARLRTAIGAAAGGGAARVATTAGYGPRYLHSTGQLHKGGPPAGAFLALEESAAQDLPVPGEDYGFATLERAQELGDLIALERRGRPVLRVRLGPDGIPGVTKAVEAARR